MAWLVLAGVVATHSEAKFNIPAIVTVPILGVVSLYMARVDILRSLNGPTNIYRCDLTVDVNIWAKEIMKRLLKDNQALTYSFSDNKYVVGGLVVVIPQPGARPTVRKNRASFPGTIVRRSDSVISYVLDEYSTDPNHVTLNELANISYDKMGSVITDLFGYLIQDCADDTISKWAAALPSANLINTSGAATAALETGQTGNRKAFTWQDLRDAGSKMNKANVLRAGRVALLEENMYQQFVDSVIGTTYNTFSKDFDGANGVVGRLFGFDIMTRSSVAMAAHDLDTGALDVNAFDAATAADDDVVSLCWQRDAVAFAQGSVHLFNRANDPEYYGDINSTSMRAGGRVRRDDFAGIIGIKQTAA